MSVSSPGHPLPFSCQACDRAQLHPGLGGAFRCEACGLDCALRAGLRAHQERCPALLSRRGSVATVGTSSESSELSPLVLEEGNDFGEVEERRRSLEQQGLLLRPQPLHLGLPQKPVLEPLLSVQHAALLQPGFLPEPGLAAPASAGLLGLRPAELCALLGSAPGLGALPGQLLLEPGLGEQLPAGADYKQALDGLLAEQQLLRALLEVSQPGLLPLAAPSLPPPPLAGEQLLLKLLDQPSDAGLALAQPPLPPSASDQSVASLLSALSDLAARQAPQMPM